MATATHSHTAKSASRRRTPKKSAASRSKDAIAVLKSQHREVEKLFTQFRKARVEHRKVELCREICMNLKIHTQIEEELLYPHAHDEIADHELIDEALVEHRAAKELIAEIERTRPSDEMFAARMQVLCEQIEHHVKEEESELFPELRKTDMDLKAIGAALEQRTKELKAQMSGDGRGLH